MTVDELIQSFEECEGIKLPKRRGVCPRCRGEGAHANPAFDGTTTEWWYESDPSGEELEEYLHGTRYDVQCEECRGMRVVWEVDEEQLRQMPELHEAWTDWLQSESETRSIEAQERAMGA